MTRRAAHELFTPADLSVLAGASGLSRVEYHRTIGSTNDRAAELAASSALECPYLVLADQQTAGRGRGANTWWSGAGSLTFSLIVDTKALGLETERWPQAALAVGLAVRDAIAHHALGFDVQVKWPNDVYLAGRKVSGILVEVPAMRAGRLVVGVGMNVNNELGDAPAEVHETATSLAEIAGRSFDRTELLCGVLKQLQRRLGELAGAKNRLFDEWRQSCLLTGRRVHLQAGSRDVIGLCEGIDDEGRLQIATTSGVEACLSGTIVGFE